MRKGRFIYLTIALMCLFAARAAAQVVLPAQENPGVPCDLYPQVQGSDIIVYLPTGARNAQVVLMIDGQRAVTDATDQARALRVGGTDYRVRVLRSDIPSLLITLCESSDEMLTSPDHSVFAYGDMTLQTPESARNKWPEAYISADGDASTPGSLKIRGRGNSTWDPAPGARKSFQINLEKKCDLLGMGKAKKWVLLHNTQTMVTMMDKLAYELAHEMGMRFTPECEFTDVFLNGEYIGLYLLTEKTEVGASRVDITDLDAAAKAHVLDLVDTTGGYLVEVDNYPDDLQFVADDATHLTVTVKSPKMLSADGVVSPVSAYAYICGYMKDFIAAVYGDGYLGDGRYFTDSIDMDSFMRYYWLQEFIMNHDGGFGSCYFYKDADSVDSLLYAGPLWDCNNAFFINRQQWLVRNMLRANGHPAVYNALMNHRAFADAAVAYYQRAGLARLFANVPSRVAAHYAYIARSIAMDELRWPSEYAHRKAGALSAVLKERAAWIDEHYRELSGMAVKSDWVKNADVMTLDFSNAHAAAENEKVMLEGFGDGLISYGKSKKITIYPLKCAGSFRLSLSLDNVQWQRNNQRILSIPGLAELYTGEYYDKASGKTTHNAVQVQQLNAGGSAVKQSVLFAGSGADAQKIDLSVSFDGSMMAIRLIGRSAEGVVLFDAYGTFACAADGDVDTIVLLNRRQGDRALGAEPISFTFACPGE